MFDVLSSVCAVHICLSPGRRESRLERQRGFYGTDTVHRGVVCHRIGLGSVLAPLEGRSTRALRGMSCHCQLIGILHRVCAGCRDGTALQTSCRRTSHDGGTTTTRVDHFSPFRFPFRSRGEDRFFVCGQFTLARPRESIEAFWWTFVRVINKHKTIVV